MTTFEPGAIEVLTQGGTDRPFSTAFLASIAAAIITEGFEVLVHDVIDAIDTMPWSISNVAPSAVVTVTLRDGRADAGGLVGRLVAAVRARRCCPGAWGRSRGS